MADDQSKIYVLFLSLRLSCAVDGKGRGGRELKAFLYQTLRRLISTRIAKNKDFPFADVGNDCLAQQRALMCNPSMFGLR